MSTSTTNNKLKISLAQRRYVGMRLLNFGVAFALTALAAAQPTVAQQPAPIVQGAVVEVVKFATLPSNANGETARINAITRSGNRLFALEAMNGRVWEITGGSTVLWFDAAQTLTNLLGNGNGIDFSNTFHGGLRSVAFHPEFATNRKFYTSQMMVRTGSDTLLSDAENPIDAVSVVSEWTVDGSGQVRSDLYREILRIGLPNYDHPVKQIAFNPNANAGDEDYGLLYIGHGDGSIGSSFGSGQDNDALGKVLRINPLFNGASYTVPSSNPFVGNASMLDEAYSIGHRNPHSLAFTKDGTLIVADAGRDNAEEVNLIQAGGDYGWSAREGTFVHLPGGGFLTGVEALPANDAQFGYIYPAAQYGHEGISGTVFTQHSIIGGFAVENGSALDGQYLYGEFTRQGEIYHSAISELKSAVTQGDPGALTQAPTRRAQMRFDHDNNPATPAQVKLSMLDVIDDSPLYDGSGRSDLRFGQGPNGEVYVSSKRNNTVYLITSSVKTPDDPPSDDPLTLMTTPDRVAPGEYGWVKFADNTKQWIDGACRNRLSDAGVALESKQWNDIAAFADNAVYRSCDDIVALLDESTPLFTRIVTTPDKESLPNYGWVVYSDNTKQWIDANCRAQLDGKGLTTELLPWSAIAVIPDGEVRACGDIPTGPVDDSLAYVVVTPDRTASGNYGWVVLPTDEKQWIDGACRDQLEAAGLRVDVEEWANISVIADATNLSSCEDFLD